MLWDLVRDFFVQHIFGGYTSDGSSYFGRLGMDFWTEDYISTNSVYIPFSFINYDGDSESGIALSFGDYFSNIATIITLVIIVILCALFIKKIVNLVGGLIR